MVAVFERTPSSRTVDVLLPGEVVSNFTVSRLQEKNIPEFVQIYRDTIGDIQGVPDRFKNALLTTRTEANYRKNLKNPDTCLFVAKDKSGAIVGVLEGRLDVSQRIGRTVFTGVVKEQRQKGVATALKTSYEDLCRSKGVAMMTTNIPNGNTPSVITNMRIGYRPDRHFRTERGSKIYTKKLK